MINEEIKGILEEKINDFKITYEASYKDKILNIRNEWKCICCLLGESEEKTEGAEFFVGELLSISFAGAASCLNYLELVEGAEIDVVQKIGRPIFAKIKMLYLHIESLEQRENIVPYELWELLLAMLYCYRYDAEIAAYLPRYLKLLMEWKGEQLWKELLSWRMVSEEESAGETLIHTRDEWVGLELLNDIKELFGDEQLLRIQNVYLKKDLKYQEKVMEQFWEYVDYIRQECPKSMQKLLFEDVFQEKLKEKKGSDKEANRYILNSKHPERYLFCYYARLYNKYRNSKSADEILEDWQKSICEENVSVIGKTAKCWAQWFYEMKMLLLRLQKEDMDENAFLVLLKEMIGRLVAYDYKADYLKKMATLFSDVFCYVYINKWNCKAVCDVFGNSNIFLYTNDEDINGFINELQGIERKELHEEATRAFISICKNTTLEDVVWLYMNTNLRFVYDIRRLLSFLTNRLEDKDISCYHNVEFWEYLRLNPVTLKYNDFGKKIVKIKDADSFVKSAETDTRVQKHFAKRYIEFLFSKYELEARIIDIDQINRRDKVEVEAVKVHTGFRTSGNSFVQERYVVYYDETWTQYNRGEVFTWRPDRKTKCRICGYDNVHRKIYVKEDVQKSSKVNVTEEMHRLLTWLKRIQEDKIVYDPYLLLGGTGDIYRNALLKGEVLNETLKKAWLYPDKPDDSLSVVFAQEIFNTMCCLERTEEDEITENAPKLIAFLKQLNRGVMDSINEYKYTAKASNNGGPGKWDGGEYVLKTPRKELIESAESDLKRLFDLKGFSLIDKSNIYMNTYLKQYIPLPRFWEMVIQYTQEDERDFKTFFVSTEDQDKEHNTFYFCLTYVGEVDERGKLLGEFQLFPHNELWDSELWKEYRWIYKFWKHGKYGTGKVKEEKKKYWGSVFGIDVKNKRIYLKDIQRKDGVKEPWENLELKLKDLVKINGEERERLNRQVQAIQKILENVKDKEAFYGHGNRLLKITGYLERCFEKQEYDVDTMKIIIDIFREYNPYIAAKQGDSGADLEKISRILASDKFNKIVEGCMEKYIECFSSVKYDISSYLAVYCNSFLCLSKKIPLNELVKQIQDKTGWSETDIRSKM